MAKLKIKNPLLTSANLQQDVLMIGQMYVKLWKIPVNKPLTVQFGSFKHRMTVVTNAKCSGLCIDQSLMESMGLYSGVPIQAIYQKDNQTLLFGPLLGILISYDYPHLPNKPFGSITSFCKEVVDACQLQGAWVCFFTPNDIQSIHTIQAWVYINGVWRKNTLPIPNVINNRLSSRKLENKPNVQQFMKEIKLKHQSFIFNERFLDKSEVFTALCPHPELTKYLPESYLLRNLSTLKYMCNRYATVFLKPIRGSLGKGIIRITQLPDHRFQAQHTIESGTKHQHFSNITKLFSSLSNKIKMNRYQIQQGLPLITYHKRPVDFRALVQKNAAGNWSITSIVARIASDQHFVSNLARGGSLSKVNEVIQRTNLPTIAKHEARTQLKQAALVIAKGIDTYIPTHFGELGVDLAVDHFGKVWLIEVNSKPSKKDNTPLNASKIRPSVRKLVDYARFLIGF